MARKAEVKLTRFELEVMEALWSLGGGSVREIRERLPARKRPAYTTVQTIVYRLEEKGALRRAKKVGNAHVFEPLVTRRATARRLLDDVLDFFGGSPRALVAQLVETGRLTLEDVREVEGALARLEAARGGTGEARDEGGGEGEGGGANVSAARPARDAASEAGARRGGAKGRGRK
jgi:BlaI family transcriptional regulator, penicillinase repressor